MINGVIKKGGYMNIFELAERQILREGQEPTEALILAYAVKIRKFYDRHKGVADKILAGRNVYQYGNRFVFSNR
jgi:hypothetical protein